MSLEATIRGVIKANNLSELYLTEPIAEDLAKEVFVDLDRDHGDIAAIFYVDDRMVPLRLHRR